MATRTKTVDMGGLDIKCKDLYTGALKPGQAGTLIATTSGALTGASLTVTGEVAAATLDVATGGILYMKEVTFTETAGAGEYTGSVVVPAGAYLVDVIVHGVAVWDNAGAVDMDVGFAGDATIFDITSLKAAGDLLAGESISFGTGSDGGEAGTLGATNYARYNVAARTITGAITTAGAGGSTGRTRMIVIWTTPTASDTSAAVKV